MQKTIEQLETEFNRASAKYIAVLRNSKSTDKQIDQAEKARNAALAALKQAEGR